jgi:hypothetical protein
MYDLLDFYKTKTVAYNPQSDGGSEVFMRQFKQMITCFIQEPKIQNDWDEKIPILTYAYNTATHSTTGFSPYEKCMGRIKKQPIDLFDNTITTELQINNHEFFEQIKNNFKHAYKLVKDNRLYIMNKAKYSHDRQIAECNFKKGDKVWLLFQSRNKGITSSIAPKHSGSFTVLEVLNNGTN